MVVDCAAMNIGVYIAFSCYKFFGNIPRSGIAGFLLKKHLKHRYQYSIQSNKVYIKGETFTNTRGPCSRIEWARQEKSEGETERKMSACPQAES